jgi:hypothetical protein
MQGEPPSTSRPEPVGWLHTFRARVLYYLTFILAVIALVRVIHYGRAVAGDPRVPMRPVEGLGLTVLWAGILAGCLFVLGLYIYEDLRWKGRIGRKSKLYERILGSGKRVG